MISMRDAEASLMLHCENNELVGAGDPTGKPQAVDLREGRSGLPIHAGGSGLVRLVPRLMGMFPSRSATRPTGQSSAHPLARRYRAHSGRFIRHDEHGHAHGWFVRIS